MMPALDVHSVSICGDRERNEDAVGRHLADGRLTFVVCDGLGGHQGGATAAGLARDTLLAVMAASAGIDPEQAFGRAIAQAHGRVAKQSEQTPTLRGMATTGAIIHIAGQRAWWAHIGDTRVYHLRNGALLHRTRDQSVVQMLVDSGHLSASQMAKHPDRNRLLQSIGGVEAPRPAMQGPVAVQAGDVFVLCSDGLWEQLTDDDFIRATAQRSARAICSGLIRQAQVNAPGRCDNITAVVIVAGSAGRWTPLPPLGPLERVLAAIVSGLIVGCLGAWLVASPPGPGGVAPEVPVQRHPITLASEAPEAQEAVDAGTTTPGSAGQPKAHQSSAGKVKNKLKARADRGAEDPEGSTKQPGAAAADATLGKNAIVERDERDAAPPLPPTGAQPDAPPPPPTIPADRGVDPAASGPPLPTGPKPADASLVELLPPPRGQAQ